MLDLRDMIEEGVFGEWAHAGGDEYKILCLNPEHQPPDSNLGSFYINVERGVYKCWSCQRGGSARHVLKWYGIEGGLGPATSLPKKKMPQRVRIIDDVVLYAWRYEPTPWVDEGLTVDTLLQHEIGYDRFNKRITVPIRNRHGELLGISGRATEEWQYARYKFYTKEFMDYMPEGYGASQAKQVLWRHHLLRNPSKVVVCEGFKAAMWLYQNGEPDVVATLGCNPETSQINLLASMQVPVIIFYDGDSAGVKGAESLGIKLYRLGARVSYAAFNDDYFHPKALSPDDLTRGQIETAIGKAKPYNLQRRPYGHMEPTCSIRTTTQAGKRHGRRRRIPV
jgi:DNA primase